jgi:hypothetical protein
VRLVFVLPAVVVPLALGAAIVVCRQLVDAARAVDAEMRALRTIVVEMRATRQALAAVPTPRAGPRPTPR